MTTLEQQARDMLERAGVESAQSMTSGDLVEVANMMNEVYELRAALERARALLAEYQNGEPQDATWRHDYGAKLAALLAAAPGGAA